MSFLKVFVEISNGYKASYDLQPQDSITKLRQLLKKDKLIEDHEILRNKANNSTVKKSQETLTKLADLKFGDIVDLLITSLPTIEVMDKEEPTKGCLFGGFFGMFFDDDCEKRIKYPDGVYIGEVTSKKRHAKGIMKYSNGDVYDGDWENDTRHGTGVLKSKGSVYTGEFKNDKKHGWGTIKNSDGSSYEGEWKADEKHGQGKFTWADGSEYNGQWFTDKQHGQGVKNYANGDWYDGNWINKKGHGKGKMNYADGQSYEGEWLDGKRHGTGIQKLVNGDVYEGEFAHHEAHGKGKWTDAKGAVYRGEWVHGNATGEGRRISVSFRNAE